MCFALFHFPLQPPPRWRKSARKKRIKKLSKHEIKFRRCRAVERQVLRGRSSWVLLLGTAKMFSVAMRRKSLPAEEVSFQTKTVQAQREGNRVWLWGFRFAFFWDCHWETLWTLCSCQRKIFGCEKWVGNDSFSGWKLTKLFGEYQAL